MTFWLPADDSASFSSELHVPVTARSGSSHTVIDIVSVNPWLWGAFFALVAFFLALDLFVFHRKAHTVSMREAAAWTAVWVVLGLGFGGLVWIWQGSTAAGEYLAGYLIEKSLSVDNIFVFALLLAYFGVPTAYQHRVLFWGVIGAIVLRAAFIVGGAALLEVFHWLVDVFGALLVLTGVRMALDRHDEVHPERNPVLRLAQQFIPIMSEYRDQRYFVRDAGRVMATPLFAVLLAVETTDVIFAVDSIPAIFAVTRDPFLVLTSNIFAVLGLRALYFMLAGMMHRFMYLQFGLAAIVVLVGAKMLAAEVVEVPIWVSLAVISAVVAVAVLASLRATRSGRDLSERTHISHSPTPHVHV